MAFRIANFVFIALFVFSAALQYNDPDPLEWAAIYLAAAGGCVLFSMKTDRVLMAWAASTTTVALIWSAVLVIRIVSMPGEVTLRAVFGSAAMLNERVEMVRETGGLWIVSTWMAALLIAARRRALAITSQRSRNTTPGQ